MSILSDSTLHRMLEEFIPSGSDHTLVNSASIDIRIGRKVLVETQIQLAGGYFRPLTLQEDKDQPVWLSPGDFALLETYEHIRVPNGYAVELKLKSSRAREGYNHSLAFWVDPGWDGILTMEVSNITKYHSLPLWCGMKFAQIIVHELDKPAEKPYQGKYNRAIGVEQSK